MLNVTDQLPFLHRLAYVLGKQAAAAEPAYNLCGTLYVSTVNGKPWGLLSVPNALVRGVFDAMHEPGIELPLNADGRLAGHITVFRPDELALLGGPQALANDRGKPFRYTIGRLVSLEPAGWPDVKRVFCLRIHSPELQQLRRSYGLSGRPNNDQYDFHVSIAVIRRGVLERNDKHKETAAA